MALPLGVYSGFREVVAPPRRVEGKGRHHPCETLKVTDSDMEPGWISDDDQGSPPDAAAPGSPPVAGSSWGQRLAVHHDHAGPRRPLDNVDPGREVALHALDMGDDADLAALADFLDDPNG